MPKHESLDDLISKKAAEFADQIKVAAAMADKEEEIRIESEKQLAFIQKDAGIKLEGKHEFTVASGRVDSVYSRPQGRTPKRGRRLPANLNSDNAGAHEPPFPARPMRKRDWTKARPRPAASCVILRTVPRRSRIPSGFTSPSVYHPRTGRAPSRLIRCPLNRRKVILGFSA